MPLTLVAIDEIQRYLEHKDHGEKVLELLTDLVKVGPAAGIILVLATQKPDSKVMPDSLRGQIGTRFAMRTMTWQASETILGAGTYTTGLDSSRWRVENWRGDVDQAVGHETVGTTRFPVRSFFSVAMA
jgi:S-DNA-T family DNA segregation ATPase FtsK/SpoIIIE